MDLGVSVIPSHTTSTTKDAIQDPFHCPPYHPSLAPLLTHASQNSPEQAALEDVQTLSTDLTNLDHAVQKWNGNLLSAISLQQDASSAQDDIDQALEDTKQIESIEPRTHDKLATALRAMESRAVRAVGHLVDKVYTICVI